MSLRPFRFKITQDYDPKHMLTNFEDLKVAKFRKKTIIATLQDHGQHGALVGILKACKKGERCGSACCPVCLRRFRRGYCSQLIEFINRHKAYDWRFLTLVPPDQIFSVGALGNFRRSLITDRLHKQFDRSSLSGAIILGGWDFALQFRTWMAPRWRPHLHCLVGNAKRGELQRVLRPRYQKDENTLVPVKVRTVKSALSDYTKVATYTVKSTIDRSNAGMQNRYIFSKRHVLSPRQAADIYPVLHEMQFSGRLFRRNAPKGLNFRA